MKIIKLTVENFKGIKVAEIAPKTNMVQIEGANGQGKSSIIDAIESVFRSGHYLPDLPVRLGAENASIIAEIGDGKDVVTIEKVISPDKKTKLKVTKNGAKYSKPQELLDDLCNGVSFDPMEFITLKPRDRVDMLKRALGIDFAALDKQREDLEKKRLVAFQIKQGAKHSLQKYDGVEKIDLPDIGETRKSLDQAKEYNDSVTEQIRSTQLEINKIEVDKSKVEMFSRMIDQKRMNLKTKNEMIERLKNECYALEQEMIIANQEMVLAEENYHSKIKPLEEYLAEVKNCPLMDTKTLQRQIDDHVVLSKQNNLYELKLEAEAEYTKKESEWENLDNQIREIDITKKNVIESVKMPVENMTFSDDTVMIAGVPLEQVNTATQIRLSADIAMRVNPTLKVIRIKNGALLDESMMAVLEEMAILNGQQVWIECVAMQKSGENSFFIEEGEIK